MVTVLLVWEKENNDENDEATFEEITGHLVLFDEAFNLLLKGVSVIISWRGDGLCYCIYYVGSREV